MTTDTKDPPADYGNTAYANRMRERKVIELEEIAIAAGVKAADLGDTKVRKHLLAVLARERGKAVGASETTWRLLWKFMHDRETGGVR